MKPHSMHVNALASYFSRFLLETIGSDKLSEVNRLNAEHPNAGCHSGNYCDPNELMLRAWVHLFGREINLQSNEDCELWGNAWNFAKVMRFFQP